jgi:DNA replication protein DnaC
MTPEPEFKPDHPTQHAEAWARRLECIPPLFRDNDLAKFTPRSRALVESLTREKLRDDLRHGRGMVIAGPVGTNKTRLACFMALSTSAASWCKIGFLSAANIRARALADWGNAADIIDAATKPDVLVIDDLGKGSPTATVDEICFAILDQRANFLRQTFVTTNYDPTTLQTRFKEQETARAIMRRLLEFNSPFNP